MESNTGGRRGILTVRGSNWFHMTTAGITSGLGQLRLPYSPSRGLVQTQLRGARIKPENKSWVSKTIRNLMPMPYYQLISMRRVSFPKRVLGIQKGKTSYCKENLLQTKLLCGEFCSKTISLSHDIKEINRVIFSIFDSIIWWNHTSGWRTVLWMRFHECVGTFLNRVKTLHKRAPNCWSP